MSWIVTEWDPWGINAVPFIRAVREILKEGGWDTNAVSDVQFFGAATELLDGVDSVYASSPAVFAAVVFVVVFVLSGIAFRSLLISVRLLLTIVLSIVCTYAAGLWVLNNLMGCTYAYWIAQPCLGRSSFNVTPWVDYCTTKPCLLDSQTQQYQS